VTSKCHTNSSHYRSIVILRVLKELSVKETAEILGCTEGKVRVDFHRAINQLKKELIINEGGDFHEETKSIQNRL
jgi:RNA polymerase sigma-70 factor (ECF subfamily)